jgi:hypothetical protein
MSPMHLPSADVVTASATVALALLALASAIYARRLWIEATKQFAEMERSTDLDIALRLLARCDDPEIVDAEGHLGDLQRAGVFASRDSLSTWLRNTNSDLKAQTQKETAKIFTLYEHVGIVVRKVPATTEILVDYLCLRVPALWDSLSVIVELDRNMAPVCHGEFEQLAKACREFAERSGANVKSMTQ